MNVFPIQSELYLRKHPIISNKDVNNIIIEMLVKIRKEAITKKMGRKVYEFPAFFNEEYPQNFLRCNNRRYVVEPRGSDGLRFFPIQQMHEDIIKNEEQSITIRYSMPKYEFPLPRSEEDEFEKRGWKITTDIAIESEYNKKIKLFDAYYDSAEEIDIICCYEYDTKKEID